MTGAEVVEAIPFSAWEQAVFVALFILFSLGMLYWFSRQSDKWQKFMFDIDEKWRAFNREQRQSNLESMNCVEGSLKDLTTVTQGLVNEVREMRDDSKAFYESFRAHDQQAKEILQEVKTNGKPAPKPRAKKPADDSSAN
jgi:phytoene dehydrogenase-like protein